MVYMLKKLKKSSDVVIAAFIGAFSARWIDDAMAYPFPTNVIMLILIAFFLLVIAYKCLYSRR